MKNIPFALLPFALALPLVSCAPRLPSDDSLLLYASARNVYREGRFEKAASMLAGEKSFAPALVLRGKSEYLSDDLVSAGKSLKRALALKPNNTEAALFLARVAHENGNTAEAQEISEKILADNPYDIRTLRFAAELAGEKGVSGEAAQAALLDRAVEASAESALIFLARSRLRWTGGNKAGALEDLGRAGALLEKGNPLMKAVEKLEYIINEVSR